MATLTVFIIPGDNPRLLETTCGLLGLDVTYYNLKTRGIPTEIVETDWYGYWYHDEFIESSLAKALPTFLNQDTYNVIALAKRVIIDGKITAFGVSPRIFRKEVALQGLMPYGDINTTRVLDGWLGDGNGRKTSS